jgi:glycosyltransferase involved in cell wall biosynthesis
MVDNASSAFPAEREYAACAPAGLRLIREPRLGLTSARLAGIRASRGAAIVFVDDDNVLAPDYLETVVRIFAAQPSVGAAGGKSLPTFETPPAPWQEEFLPLLALRDPGPEPATAAAFRPEGAARNAYPPCAPIGAGMALRREAALAWAGAIEREPLRLGFDRTGAGLVSGGDNDIVMTVMEHGWAVGYFPDLVLRHLIPAGRLDPRYLARLNHAMQRSWVKVLSLHGASPWPPIARWTVPLRKAKAAWVHQPWRSASRHIRWSGVCGHFQGRAEIPRC